MAQPKKRHGCLIFMLIVILLIGIAGFGVWKFVINRPINPIALEIINGPIDTEASRRLNEELTQVSGEGITAVVVPIPDTAENATIIVIDTASGFQPAAGRDGKRKQIMDGIQTIIQNNEHNNLGISTVALTYQEGGKKIISVAGTMEDLKALNSGTLSETDFATKMGLEVNDIMYFRNLIGD